MKETNIRKFLVSNIFISIQMGVVLVFPLFEFLQNVLHGIIRFDISFLMSLLESIKKWWIGYSSPGHYFFSFAFMTVLLLLSILLSIRFYNRRNL